MDKAIDEPCYSILLSGQKYEEWSLRIRVLLSRGIKVYWIGERFNELSTDGIDYKPYLDTFLLIYNHKDNPPALIIIDGNIDPSDPSFRQLSIDCFFDFEQYLVEHCSPYANAIVRASAGTGKTAVMINRIMYLVHKVPGIKLSDMAMITFTNEASNEMRKRLQNVLMNRFTLTHDTRYMDLLEQQSGMKIGTIHSFELDLIKNLGVEMGLSGSTEIRSLTLQINDMIDGILDGTIDYDSEIREQIGAAYYEVRRIVKDLWRELSQKGYGRESIAKLQWGEAITEEGQILQDALKGTLQNLAMGLEKLKRNNDSVMLSDMQCDLKRLVSRTKKKHLSSIRYLFVDEFQDTDDAQIAVMAEFIKADTHIFAVGDVKQSIYRFRGANSNSFQVLERVLSETSGSELRTFELFYNYRSSPDILNPVNEFFTKLSGIECRNSGGNTQLQTFKPLKAMKSEMPGRIAQHYYKEDDKEDAIVRAIRGCIEDFDIRHADVIDESELSEKERVVALVRTNWQLSELESLCSKNDIPAIVNKEGCFYQSDAVRDLKAMLGAFVYTGDPIHLFNYLECPFSGVHDPVDHKRLMSCNGDRDLVLTELRPILEQTPWETYKRMFTESPVLSVLEHMTSNVDILSKYESIHRKKLAKEGYSGLNLDKMLKKSALQYSRNLKKLLELLYEEFKSLDTGCYDVYDFLSIQMATNHDEKEALIADGFHKGCIHCMTVHAAKGLEFDTVIIPFTDTGFHHYLKKNDRAQNRILTDGETIGWLFTKGKTELKNRNYDYLMGRECNNETAEETRLLYVAMTRPTRSLDILIPEKNRPETWSQLIKDNLR